MNTPTTTKRREVLEALVLSVRRGERGEIDLRPEDGPSIWPVLLRCACGDFRLAVAVMHALEGPLNTPRGGFFLPWARKQSTPALLAALESALESLCECGVVYDPEDAAACDACLADAAVEGWIHAQGEAR